MMAQSATVVDNIPFLAFVGNVLSALVTICAVFAIIKINMICDTDFTE
jgi:hypothetical protein